MQGPQIYLHVAIRQETRENRRTCGLKARAYFKALKSRDRWYECN